MNKYRGLINYYYEYQNATAAATTVAATTTAAATQYSGNYSISEKNMVGQTY